MFSQCIQLLTSLQPYTPEHTSYAHCLQDLLASCDFCTAHTETFEVPTVYVTVCLQFGHM